MKFIILFLIFTSALSQYCGNVPAEVSLPWALECCHHKPPMTIREEYLRLWLGECMCDIGMDDSNQQLDDQQFVSQCLEVYSQKDRLPELTTLDKIDCSLTTDLDSTSLVIIMWAHQCCNGKVTFTSMEQIDESQFHECICSKQIEPGANSEYVENLIYACAKYGHYVDWDNRR